MGDLPKPGSIGEPTARAAAEAGTTPRIVEVDHIGFDWYLDKAVQLSVFVAGISAIVFIL